MIAFNPDLIEVEITEVNSESVNWKMSVPSAGGVAYIRISPEFRDFLKRCHSEQGVIGFKYDFEANSLNFGLVLKKIQNLE